MRRSGSDRTNRALRRLCSDDAKRRQDQFRGFRPRDSGPLCIAHRGSSDLTALLAGTFVGLVALTTDLLPFSSSVGVAASTLAAAALFNPLRKRVQRVVDRRFNRARYDAEETVAAFAAQLRDAVDIDTVQSELLQVVQKAVEPAHATIWIRRAESR